MSTTIPSPDDEEKIYPSIANALLKSIPEDWDEIQLLIEPVGSGQIRLKISGPAGAPDLRAPGDSLYEPTIRLYDLFVRKACPFARCDFKLRWNEVEESWHFAADFDYPPKA